MRYNRKGHSAQSVHSHVVQAKLPNGKELTCYKSPLFFSLYNKELQRKHGAWGILAGDKGHPEWNTAGEESSPTPPDNQLKCPEIFHKPSKYWFFFCSLSLFHQDLKPLLHSLPPSTLPPPLRHRSGRVLVVLSSTPLSWGGSLILQCSPQWLLSFHYNISSHERLFPSQPNSGKEEGCV